MKVIPKRKGGRLKKNASPSMAPDENMVQDEDHGVQIIGQDERNFETPSNVVSRVSTNTAD